MFYIFIENKTHWVQSGYSPQVLKSRKCYLKYICRYYRIGIINVVLIVLPNTNFIVLIRHTLFI